MPVISSMSLNALNAVPQCRAGGILFEQAKVLPKWYSSSSLRPKSFLTPGPELCRAAR